MLVTLSLDPGLVIFSKVQVFGENSSHNISFHNVSNRLEELAHMRISNEKNLFVLCLFLKHINCGFHWYLFWCKMQSFRVKCSFGYFGTAGKKKVQHTRLVELKTWLPGYKVSEWFWGQISRCPSQFVLGAWQIVLSVHGWYEPVRWVYWLFVEVVQHSGEPEYEQSQLQDSECRAWPFQLQLARCSCIFHMKNMFRFCPRSISLTHYDGFSVIFQFYTNTITMLSEKRNMNKSTFRPKR